ncbi:MAG: hypothetical protein HYV63_11220 [Candidatus Schekmanbacteria bacterium]|nr:hypothetical protein [Candidatus Schekmanbacteria bacterium]
MTGSPAITSSTIAKNSGSGVVLTGTGSATGSVIDWTDFVPSPTLPSNVVRSLALASSGGAWFGTDKGATYYDSAAATYSTLTSAAGLPADKVSALAVTPDGAVWFGTLLGLARRDAGGTWTTYGTAEGLPSANVQTLGVDPQTGDLWAGTFAGAARFDGAAFEAYTTATGLVHNEVYSVGFDAAGNVWFGTLKGASRLSGARRPLAPSDCAHGRGCRRSPGVQTSSAGRAAGDRAARCRRARRVGLATGPGARFLRARRGALPREHHLRRSRDRAVGRLHLPGTRVQRRGGIEQLQLGGRADRARELLAGRAGGPADRGNGRQHQPHLERWCRGTRLSGRELRDLAGGWQ